MISVIRTHTSNPSFSIGRAGMDQRDIWAVEDAGGFKKVLIRGTLAYPGQFTDKSIAAAVDEYRKMVDSKECIAMMSIEVPGVYLNIDNTYGVVTKITGEGNDAVFEITLLDVRFGRFVNKMIQAVDESKIELVPLGISEGNEFKHIATVAIKF